MHNYARRDVAAKNLERRIDELLPTLGYQTRQQSPLPQEAHAACVANRVKYPLRWWPDRIAWRESPFDIFMVDAKAGGLGYPNFSIEDDAMWLYTILEDLNFKVLIVFDDLTGIWLPDLVKNSNGPHDGTRSNGSGTDYHLLPKSHTTPIGDLLTPVYA